MAATASPADALPLFDLFIDLPYPASDSSKIHAPPVVLPPPTPSTAADELKSGNGIARVARFAFPEHDDGAYAGELQRQKAVEQATGVSGGLNRHDVYMQNYVFASHLTFAMQLSNGSKIFGHVRRYLPSHPDAKTRHDVGRRSARAIVLITRHVGGDAFFASALKTIDALFSLASATSTSPQGPVRDFCYGLYGQHAKHCASFEATSSSTSSRGRSALFCSLNGLEFGANQLSSTTVDTTRVVVPHVLLRHHPGYTAYASSSSAILPIVRRLGINLSIRLLSALLTEQRVILLSNSPVRLSTVSRGALSLLAQGMLDWPHLYIPILPPGLLKVATSPAPYLLGILSRHAATLEKAPGLGEVFVLDLDAKSFKLYNSKNAETVVPDLLRPAFLVADNSQVTQSPAEALSLELHDILKADRRFMVMKTASKERIGNAQDKIEKGRKQVKKAFGGLKKKLAGSKDTGPVDDDELIEAQLNADVVSSDVVEEKMGSDLYEYTEGFPNETCESQCRVAFVIFFLSLLGDMQSYLSQPPAGSGTPVLDIPKFITSRRNAGDIEGSPMFPLITAFSRTKLFEKFAHDRVVEVLKKEPVRPDAPLFLLTANHCRVKRIGFSMVNVRRVAKELSVDSFPESIFLMRKTDDIRRCGSSLTSSKGFSGNGRAALSQMIEDSHETSHVLVDVMSVIWTRLDDCRGPMWKHGLLALQILKKVLVDGPLAAICEATDNIDKIRALKSYTETAKHSHRDEVQAIAREIYNLLVDRARLFRLRREEAEKRRQIKTGTSSAVKRRAPVRLNMGFKNLHQALRPGSVAPSSGGRQMLMTAATTDLLNKSLAPQGMAAAAAAVAAPAPTSYADDLLGLGFSAPEAPPPPAPVAAVPAAPPPAFSVPPAPAASPSFSYPPAPAAAAPAPSAYNAFDLLSLSQATPAVPAPAPSTVQYGLASPAQPAPTAFGATPLVNPAQVPTAPTQVFNHQGQPPVQQYYGYPSTAAPAAQGISPYAAAPAPAQPSYAQQPSSQQFGYQLPQSQPTATQQKQQNTPSYSSFDPFG